MNPFTIGIEEEYQIIDVESRDLVSHVSKILEGGGPILGENLRHEMHESMIEMKTGICDNIKSARVELTQLRKHLIHTAHAQGLRVSGGGTHPFSHWASNTINQGERYMKILDDMGDVARENLIFGLHVHITIPSREEGIRIQNSLRHFLPYIYALSTNSPFWIGRYTGFKSYRQEVFAKFPRTGIPSYFSSLAEFDKYVNFLIEVGAIDNATKIWWDMRLHPFYPTLEFRICDMPLRIEETICIAAIIQCLVAKITFLNQHHQELKSYRKLLLNENKWRASKSGIEAELIDFEKKRTLPFTDLLAQLLEFINETAIELDCKEEIEYAWEIIKNGTGADRQLRIYNETGDLKKVVDYMISETEYGII
ncbi:carboxylate-amine ligase [Chryseobacterium sp.]|mgnify:CR=1 FL=1|uniref:carboxylate-amine ligase n=1 Tax=Chryseobacterium sp. TaxID=1871047 RepID=UPI0025C12335|nr:carboxylate-amine ligase [Chryseobacterium sp.]